MRCLAFWSSLSGQMQVGEDAFVPAPPSILHTAAGATVVANLSADCETAGKADKRRALLAAASGRLACGYVMAGAGAGESSTDLVFAGHSLIAENGALLADTGLFSDEAAQSEIDLQRLCHERQRRNTFMDASTEGYVTVLFSLPMKQTTLTRPVSPAPFVPPQGPALAARCEEVLSIQAAGLQKRLRHTGAKTVVLGVSGGLDSTLALLVAARALRQMGRPLTALCAVTMPGFGTTARTRTNAEKLCQLLGAAFTAIDIKATTRAHFEDIGHNENDHSVVYENAQARVRTLTLMDLANQKNGLVLGTGDLSELALGWATYNGDHMSMYGVNTGVPKTLIAHLLRHEADNAPKIASIIQDILKTPVSPELLPPAGDEISQQTEQLVGPYELHDFYLYYMLRWGFAPRKIARLALCAFGEQYDEKTILMWLRTFYRRFFAAQFKRSCLPDGPKVGSVGLSPRGDWNMPSDAWAALWLAELQAFS